jgi:hypothetical protein
MVEIERELARAVPLQFVQPSRDVSQVFQTHSRAERIEPCADTVGAVASLSPNQFRMPVALLLEFAVSKQDIQLTDPGQASY